MQLYRNEAFAALTERLYTEAPVTLRAYAPLPLPGADCE
jgi:hypothetical protein